MHGEYQPPGGKLVAADVEMAGGRLVRVRISGDFFPGPGVLKRIGAAVTGLFATADTGAITASIQAALGSKVVPAGICPGAVAVAVRRAVLGASDWRDHDWQLVREGPRGAAPRDDGVRHRRAEDDARAAHRAGEAVR